MERSSKNDCRGTRREGSRGMGGPITGGPSAYRPRSPWSPSNDHTASRVKPMSSYQLSDVRVGVCLSPRTISETWRVRTTLWFLAVSILPPTMRRRGHPSPEILPLSSPIPSFLEDFSMSQLRSRIFKPYARLQNGRESTKSRRVYKMARVYSRSANPHTDPSLQIVARPQNRFLSTNQTSDS
jgi:hypothetical protein